jgi:hypothetical protein
MATKKNKTATLEFKIRGFFRKSDVINQTIGIISSLTV